MKFSCAFLTPLAALALLSGANASDSWEFVGDAGNCIIEDECILSHAGAGSNPYAEYQFCTFKSKLAGELVKDSFNTEDGYDFLTIHSIRYSGGSSNLPFTVNVSPGDELTWLSDNTNQGLGFKLCLCLGDCPTLPPLDHQDSMFWARNSDWQEGECVIENECIKSHAGAGVVNYQNSEDCSFTSKYAGKLVAKSFDTERNWDYLRIDGQSMHGTIDDFPEVMVSPGDPVVWDSDNYVVELGFEVCFVCMGGCSGGTGGDPHFKTWNGLWYDFHGICDLMFLKAPMVANGKGLTIHVRTNPQYEFAYIENAVIAIGEDTLEVGSFGDYYYNGVGRAALPVQMDGSFSVTHTKVDEKKHVFEIVLDESKQESIVISTFKNMVSITVKNATFANFGTSVGMMGSFKDGSLLARDGATVMEEHDLFGQEWQVSNTEPQLFQVARPMDSCVAPSQKAAGRRLSEATVDMEAAETACAHYQEPKTKDMCIFDVMAMGDLEVAHANGAY